MEEIFLRIPPDEPAHLFSAMLVCKPWCRILTDPGFRRRYSTLHRGPPVLGYFYNISKCPSPLFVSTATASPLFSRPAAAPDCSTRLWVEDCRHGRVLMLMEDVDEDLIVWDPITGDQKRLSMPKEHPWDDYWACAVLCAVDGCDHLDCHAGPFLVVYCGSLVDNQHKTWVAVYSSETGEWGAMVSIDINDYYVAEDRPTLFIGNSLYFTLVFIECDFIRLLKYDLAGHELSVISAPDVMEAAVAMELDDGGLGFVDVLNNCIHKWSWQADANNGIGRWVQQLVVMELDTLLPRGNPSSRYWHDEVTGWVEGTQTIFISIDKRVFTLDLKSKKVKKVGEMAAYKSFYTFRTFYTPDLAKGKTITAMKMQ